MSRRAPTKARRIGNPVLLSLVSVLVFVVGAEILGRVYFAARIGRGVLFYGMAYERAAMTADEQSPFLHAIRRRSMSGGGDRNNSVRDTDNRLGAYAKYLPHQARSTYDADTGEVYPVTINSRGFRGPEFSDEKPADVIRVVTLGSSSTFGYHDRDDLTYPAQLQRLLGARCPAAKFDVVNLGIPHLTSTEILALFVAEGVRLHPDVVTFYEGHNDANALREGRKHHGGAKKSDDAKRPWTKQVGRWMRDHLLLGAIADVLLSNWTHRYSAEQIAAHLQGSRRAFLENLGELARLAEQVGFVPIVASQQSRSLLIPYEEIRGVSFQRELDLVNAELARRGWLGQKEAAFLVHGALMDAEASWARANGVLFVDVRGALDARRDTVVSWVHLNHEGNRIVAEQLAAAILNETCTSHRPGSNLADVANEAMPD